jgi:hypothetical protein
MFSIYAIEYLPSYWYIYTDADNITDAVKNLIKFLV